MGDSLAGRFFSFRLNPLDLKELGDSGSVEQNYKKLISVSGFPEPFLAGTEKYYNIWRKTHLDLILRQDLISLQNVRDIDGLELLVELLASRVGSLVSSNSLAEDLDRDDKTIRHWLTLLEDLYIIFRVSPYPKNLPRSLKKVGKYYFYDIARIEGDESQKLENLVALSLKKEIEFQEDVNGVRGDLYFLRTKDGLEIDFCVQQAKRNPLLIEVKLSDDKPSTTFQRLSKFVSKAKQIQLMKNLSREYSTPDGVKIVSALHFLKNLDLG